MSALNDAFKQLIREVLAEGVGALPPDAAQPASAKPRGRPPKEKDPTAAPTSGAVKALATKDVADVIVKLATKDRPAAVAILTKHGVAKVSELKPDQYKAVYDAAVAALAGPAGTADALA